MNCKVCGSESKFLWNKQVLQKYQADYYQCQSCDFLFVSEPTWLNEAYEDPINIYDTGLMYRNLRFADVVATLLMVFFRNSDRNFYLDYSGGYGIFVRLMRDRGFNFLWKDTYAKNLLARGFEYRDQDISFCTCFEVLEHAPDPHSLIKTLKQVSPLFLVSTEIVPAHASSSWEYLGPEHGQHICFFSNASLTKLASIHGLHVISHGSMHLFSQEKFPMWKWKAALIFAKFFGSKVRLSTSISAVADAAQLKSKSVNKVDQNARPDGRL